MSMRSCLLALAVLGVVASGCGSDGEGEGGAAATVTVPSPGTTAAATGTNVDVCQKIPADQVKPILTGVTSLNAEPPPGSQRDGYSRCNYTIEVAPNFTAAVVSIEWYRGTQFYDGQKDLQSAGASPVVGIDDSFKLNDTGTVFVKSATGTVVVGKGVELTTGGAVATDDMIKAVTQLALTL